MKEKKIVYLNVRIRETTKEALCKAALQHDRSLSWIVEKILRQYFKLRE